MCSDYYCTKRETLLQEKETYKDILNSHENASLNKKNSWYKSPDRTRNKFAITFEVTPSKMYGFHKCTVVEVATKACQTTCITAPFQKT